MNNIQQILAEGNTVMIQPRMTGDSEQWFAVYIQDAHGNDLSSAWSPILEDAVSDAYATLPERETESSRA